MKKFTKRILKNQLGATPEEIEIVMAYQKLFPMLLNEEGYKEGDKVVNTEDIHGALTTKTRYQDWIKRNIEENALVEDEDYEIAFRTKDGELIRKSDELKSENVKSDKSKFGNVDKSDELKSENVKYDEIYNMKPQQRSRKGIATLYFCTFETAKCLVMTERRNPIAQIGRRYFILMEKFLKMKVDWNNVRKDGKEHNYEYKEAFMDYVIATGMFDEGARNNPKVFAYGHDLLNLLALGMTAKEAQEAKDVKSNTRDNLEIQYNERLAFSQDKLITLFELRLDEDTIVDYMFNAIEKKFGVRYEEEFYEKINKYNRFLFK